MPLSQAQAKPSANERPQQSLQPGEIPQGLSAGEWGSIQQQLKQARYRPHADDQGGYRSANPTHGWHIHYAKNGTTTLSPAIRPAPPISSARG